MRAARWETRAPAPFKGQSPVIQPEPLAGLVGLELGDSVTKSLSGGGFSVDNPKECPALWEKENKPVSFLLPPSS